MRFAYADPPYPGMAHIYKDHKDYAGEVDHKALIERLVTEYPDGWALSTAARSLQTCLKFCPDDVRIGVWDRVDSPANATVPIVIYTWQPLIWRGGRRPSSYLRDVHSCPGDHRFIGAKPESYCFWLFRCLGALPGDTLDDLYPGSGAVGRAWETYQRQLSFIHSEEYYSGKKVKLPI